jgi:two-component system, OmpR family, response regulator AdeR
MNDSLEALGTSLQVPAYSSSMANERILIVEDDADIAEVLEAYARKAGYDVAVARDGVSAITLAQRMRPALVLLDQMLPGRSGTEVLDALRRTVDPAIIFVTALGEDVDKIGALRFGADDYIVKPFNPNEVMARVAAVLRRIRTRQHPDETLLGDGPLMLDLDARTATVQPPGSPKRVVLDLTLTEFTLLATLMRAPGKVFSRLQLLEACLPESSALERVIDTHVNNLRRKLERHGLEGVPQGVRGVGYRLRQRW